MSADSVDRLSDPYGRTALNPAAGQFINGDGGVLDGGYHLLQRSPPHPPPSISRDGGVEEDFLYAAHSHTNLEIIKVIRYIFLYLFYSFYYFKGTVSPVRNYLKVIAFKSSWY
jgi:hypothetical protein